jgi:uncharacterized protein (TIGR03663 family)
MESTIQPPLAASPISEGPATSACQKQSLSARVLGHRHFLWYFFIFTAGLLLRWVMLDARPVHHDESLHYMYGRYFFDFPEDNFHKYDPMLHGPILYNTLRLVYLTFGSSTWAGRAFICILGSLFIFTPFLFRKYLHERALLGLCAALALSPTLTFWTRFLREDMLQIWATFAVLYGVTLARPQLKAFFVLAGFSLQWCIKANFFVHLAILVGFLVFECAWNLIVRKKFEGLLAQTVRYVMAYEGQFIFAGFFASFIFVYFYTSGYRYTAGILDGLYRKSLLYWLNQHNIERIPGPFMFHVYQLSWYELLFVVAVLYQAFLLYKNAAKQIQWAAGAGLLGALVLSHYSSTYQAPGVTNFEAALPWKFLNLKDYFDVFGLFAIDVLGITLMVVHSVLVTVHHLSRQERALAFFGYFFTATLFTYSYLGEKVPWLAIYPFLTGVVYLVLFFDRFFQQNPLPSLEQFPVSKVLRWLGIGLAVVGLIFVLEDSQSLTQGLSNKLTGPQTIILGALRNAPLLTAGLILIPVSLLLQNLSMTGTVHLGRLALLFFVVFNARATLMVNQVNGGQASEFMSQVHTTRELQDFALDIRKQILTPTSGKKPQVYVTGESTWPLTWYFVDLPEYKFNVPPSELNNFDYRFQDYVADKTTQFPGYRRVDLNLRGWWVPDYQKMTFKNFLYYSMTQSPWSPTGFSYTTVLVKEPAAPRA